MEISGVLFVLFMLSLIATLALLGENRRLRARLDAKRVREGYPWDWTKEAERKAQAVLELACDMCHEPFCCSQDELDVACAMCPVPDAVYKLAGIEKTDCHTSAAALVRNDSSSTHYEDAEFEEVRG